MHSKLDSGQPPKSVSSNVDVRTLPDLIPPSQR
jgi:hypothetical protein